MDLQKYGGEKKTFCEFDTSRGRECYNQDQSIKNSSWEQFYSPLNKRGGGVGDCAIIETP